MIGSQLNPKLAIAIRVIVFALVFICLQLVWDTVRDTALERVLIHDVTVRPAAWLINLITPNVQAQAIDFSVRAYGGGLNILNGCEGLEALFLLIAAFVVLPITSRSRLIGMLVGIVFVFVINQLRILVLFYAYRADHALFDSLHSTVTPIAVVLLVGLYFYAWAFKASGHAHAT